nr:acyl-CoA dehydrogenase [Nakamurella antarctica]
MIASTDLAVLQRHLGGRWADIRATFTDQIRQIPLSDTENLDTAEHRVATLQALQATARTGIQRLGFDEKYGGGGDPGASITVFEILAQADLSLMVKAGVQWGLFGGAINALGTDVHHEKYLRPIMDADLIGCFAMTETGHGSDVQRIRTTATYDPATDEFVVHSPDSSARKDYIGNAANDGRLAVVFAQLVTAAGVHGPHALLVPIRDEAGATMQGVTITDCGRKGGLNGVDNGRLMFSQVRVPRQALLNRYGAVDEKGEYSSPVESSSRRFFTMLGTLVRGRVSVAGSAGSATKKALAIAVRYGDVRRQFAAGADAEETVLLDYPAYQRTLLPVLARTYALHFAQDELLRIMHEVQTAAEPDEQQQRELESRAAGMKALATWHASEAVSVCREACGGAGYLAENQITQLKADLDVFTTFEGANTVLLQLAGKGLMTQYREHVGDLDTVGMVGFIAEQVLGDVAEITSARSLLQRIRMIGGRESDSASLRDRDWQLALFADRTEHLVSSLGRRIQKAAKDGADSETISSRTQNHVLRAARAHVEHLVLQGFAVSIAKAEDPDLVALLGAVCDLHVLSEIERDAAWFLEHDRLTVSQTKTVSLGIDQLCAELRPHARLLVDGFSIPEEWLTAPILFEERERQASARC